MFNSYARAVAALFVGLFSLLTMSASFAQTTTDSSFKVTASVTDACQIATQDYDFGVYSPLLGTILSQNLARITVTCNLLTPYKVGLNDGVNAVGSVRNMINLDGSITANNLLSYSMGCVLPSLPVTLPGVDLTDFDLTGCALTWGNTDTSDFDGVGLGPVPLPITLAGTIVAGQNVAVGSYEDTLTATITY